MNILMANLDPGQKLHDDKWLEKRRATLHFPIGLGIIAACLKKAGWQFEVYDSYVGGTTEGFLKIIEHKKPDIVLLSGFLGNFSYAFIKGIAFQIKTINQATVIIIGGPMATTIPALLILKTPIDVVVKGEGENTIIKLLNAIEKKSELSQVKGIYFKDVTGKAVFMGERERIKNLDSYPFPLYDVFPIGTYVKYLQDTGRSWELSASRGCYNRCRFCKLIFGPKITSYSYKLVAEHMNYVSETYGINKFNFVDDNFLNHPKRVDEFVAILKNQHRKFKWRFQGRADRISPEMVEKLMEVGLFDISFGIESGSQGMLNRYGKNLDIKKTLNNLIAIKDMVEIHASFIVGGPGEDWNTIKETVKFIKQLKLNNAAIGILTLFPGTSFYDEAIKNGFIRDEEVYCLSLGPVYDRPYINISDLSDQQLLQARNILIETASEFGDYV